MERQNQMGWIMSLALCAGITLAGASSVRATLVAQYLMNEGSGTTVSDSSGFGNNGAFAGSGLTWVSGPTAAYGTGIHFNGNGYITVPDSPSLDINNMISITAWVNVDAARVGNGIVWKVNNYKVFQQNSAAYTTLSGVTGGVNAAPMGVPVGTWYHLAFTYDGANIRSYLGDVLQNTTAASGAIAITGNSLTIGWYNLGAPYFQGTLDNVRIYNEALTQAGVTRDMNTPGPIVPEPVTVGLLGVGGCLLAWWRSRK